MACVTIMSLRHTAATGAAALINLCVQIDKIILQIPQQPARAAPGKTEHAELDDLSTAIGAAST
jgi:hypothetical protein